VSYFYVAYIWENFGDVTCRADINSDLPLLPGASNTGVEVDK